MLERIMSYVVVGSLVWIAALIAAGLVATIRNPLFDICGDVLVPSGVVALFVTVIIAVIDNVKPQ